MNPKTKMRTYAEKSPRLFLSTLREGSVGKNAAYVRKLKTLAEAAFFVALAVFIKWVFGI